MIVATLERGEMTVSGFPLALELYNSQILSDYDRCASGCPFRFKSIKENCLLSRPHVVDFRYYIIQFLTKRDATPGCFHCGSPVREEHAAAGPEIWDFTWGSLCRRALCSLTPRL